MALLLPRLSRLGVSSILSMHSPGPPPAHDAASAFATYAERISFAASGGNKAPHLAFNIGAELRSIATRCGFPLKTSKAEFDRLSAIYLAQHPALQGGEALRNDVWAFIATVVVPDLVAWRFPDAGLERYDGGVRNTFQRLWLRAKALDRGPMHPERWALVDAMPEDAVVQIVERPSLGGRPRIALALGEAWQEMIRTVPLGLQEDLMRRATKMLRLQNEIIDLQYLHDDDLAATVRAAFARARAGLRPS